MAFEVTTDTDKFTKLAPGESIVSYSEMRTVVCASVVTQISRTANSSVFKDERLGRHYGPCKTFESNKAKLRRKAEKIARERDIPLLIQEG